jgi:hypothetical protein
MILKILNLMIVKRAIQFGLKLRLALPSQKPELILEEHQISILIKNTIIPRLAHIKLDHRIRIRLRDILQGRLHLLTVTINHHTSMRIIHHMLIKCIMVLCLALFPPLMVLRLARLLFQEKEKVHLFVIYHLQMSIHIHLDINHLMLMHLLLHLRDLHLLILTLL